jgi:hypothetical protein
VKDTLFYPAIGLNTGSFENLLPGSTYYVVLCSHGVTGYKTICSDGFTTTALPVPLTVSTNEVTNVNTTSAILGGNIIYDVDTISVTERGFVWSESSLPNYNTDDFAECGTGAGYFNKQIFNLIASTKYYVRAYAKTQSGSIYYGNVVNFTTDSHAPAAVADVTIHSIGSNSAFLSSYIISTGGQEITDKGFLCGLTNIPTFQSYFVISHNGPGDDSFYKTISGLWPNTKYYVRAFLVTDAGVYYGSINSFWTYP